MSFLKKLGQGILTGISLFTGFAPLFAKAYPNTGSTINEVSDDLTKVAGVIQSVEVMGQALSLPGSEKLKAAAPLVAQILLQSDSIVTHKIKDAALFNQGATKIADGMADVQNSLEG